jgi:anti-sigma-K factor RskA
MNTTFSGGPAAAGLWFLRVRKMQEDIACGLLRSAASAVVVVAVVVVVAACVTEKRRRKLPSLLTRPSKDSAQGSPLVGQVG